MAAGFGALRGAWQLFKGFRGLSRAGEFGIKPYAQLRNALKGTGLQAHHLLEQRFANALGMKGRNMLSVAVTKAEHQVFTNAWRQAIPYGPSGTGAAGADWVMREAARIYANFPAILRALGL